MFHFTSVIENTFTSFALVNLYMIATILRHEVGRVTFARVNVTHIRLSHSTREVVVKVPIDIVTTLVVQSQEPTILFLLTVRWFYLFIFHRRHVLFDDAEHMGKFFPDGTSRDLVPFDHTRRRLVTMLLCDVYDVVHVRIETVGYFRTTDLLEFSTLRRLEISIPYVNQEWKQQ